MIITDSRVTTNSARVSIEVPTETLLSANGRYHHHPKAQRVASIRQLGFIAARNAHRGPLAFEVCTCEVVVGWPNRSRKRDAPNLWPTMKAAIDGIVTDAGWLPDDDDEHIVHYGMSSQVAGRKGVVVLTFTFAAVAEASEVPS